MVPARNSGTQLMLDLEPPARPERGEAIHAEVVKTLADLLLEALGQEAQPRPKEADHDIQDWA